MNSPLRTAAELTLLFHDGSHWTDEKRHLWDVKLTELLGPAAQRQPESYHYSVGKIQPTNEATTRNLCNAVRAAMAKRDNVPPGSPFEDEGAAFTYDDWMQVRQAALDRAKAAEELIVHMWIHDGYRANGYMKMTAEQKELFCKITGTEHDNNVALCLIP